MIYILSSKNSKESGVTWYVCVCGEKTMVNVRVGDSISLERIRWFEAM